MSTKTKRLVKTLLKTLHEGVHDHLKVLLSSHVSLLNTPLDEDKKTILEYTSYHGMTDTVQWLLAAYEKSVCNKKRALEYASAHGHEAIITMLLKAGADPMLTATVEGVCTLHASDHPSEWEKMQRHHLNHLGKDPAALKSILQMISNDPPATIFSMLETYFRKLVEERQRLGTFFHNPSSPNLTLEQYAILAALYHLPQETFVTTAFLKEITEAPYVPVIKNEANCPFIAIDGFAQVAIACNSLVYFKSTISFRYMTTNYARMLLMEAAKFGRLEFLEGIIKTLNQPEWLQTGFMVAILNKQFEVVMAMLPHVLLVKNVQFEDITLPVLLESNSLVLIKYLEAKGFDFGEYKQLLHMAIDNPSMPVISYFADRYKHLLVVENKEHKIPYTLALSKKILDVDMLRPEVLPPKQQFIELYYRVLQGNLTKIKRSLSNEIQMNNIPEHVQSIGLPLHAAIKRKHSKVMAFLLKKGASVEARDRMNNSAIFIAIVHYHKPIMSLLLKQSPQLDVCDNFHKTPLMLAHDHIATTTLAQWLLRHGASINFRSSNGNTLLHHAAKTNQLPLIQFYLEHGANVHQTNHVGQTPLFIAVQSKNEPLVKLFLDWHASPHHADSRGRIPLHYTSNHTSLSIAQLLLDIASNVNHVDNNGSTPLLHAVNKVNVPLVQLFLARGATVSISNAQHNSVMHYGALSNDMSLFRLLTDHPTPLNIVNLNGLAPIHLTICRRRLPLFYQFISNPNTNIFVLNHHHQSLLMLVILQQWLV